MPEFQYIALKPGGKKESGVLNAGNRAEALTQLGRKGLRPMKLSEAGDAAMAREMRKVRKGGEDGEAVLNRSELLYFTEDMADLLENGLQLEPALAVLERRQQNSRVKTITNRLRNYVRDGGSFSKALRGASKSFSDLYCNMAEAGEISGTLPHILRRQAAYLHAINELQSKVVSSLMYPVVLVVVGFGLLIIFVTVLIPNLLTLFQKTGASMPFLTRMLFWFSEMVVGYWWLWLAIALTAFFGFWAYIRTSEGMTWWHRNQLKIPLLGTVLKQRAYTQMTFTLGTLITNGIPLLKGIELMNRANPNIYFQRQFRDIHAMVEEGGSLSLALQKRDILPGTLVDMIAVGEQTGKLGDTLLKVSTRQERLLLQSIERLTAIIQPVVIICIAGLVGVVAYAVFSGIFQTISGLQTQAGG
jgi:type II secretory pathway component PulF